jgi:hypothetical protein
MLFSPSWGIQDQMLMEKLKSWNALSNFPTATAAATAAGKNFLKLEDAQARVESIPRGLKPARPRAFVGTAEAVPFQN